MVVTLLQPTSQLMVGISHTPIPLNRQPLASLPSAALEDTKLHNNQLRIRRLVPLPVMLEASRKEWARWELRLKLVSQEQEQYRELP